MVLFKGTHGYGQGWEVFFQLAFIDDISIDPIDEFHKIKSKKGLQPVFPSHQVESDRIEIEEYKQRLQELTE